MQGKFNNTSSRIGRFFLSQKKVKHDAQERVILLVVLGITWAVVIVATKLQFPLLYDEYKYHVPAVNHFASSLDSLSSLFSAASDYTGAGGPLPYLILALGGKILGFDIASLRFISSLFTMATTIFYYLLVKELSKNNAQTFRLPFLSRERNDYHKNIKQVEPGRALTSALLLLFWPYFFVYGFTTLVHSFALFFGITGIYFFVKHFENPKVIYMILSGISLALSVLCRQTYVVFAVSVELWGLISYITHRRSSDLLIVFCSMLSGLTLVALVAMWGGLLPPMFQSRHHLHPTFEAFNLALISTAIYLFPGIYSLRKQRNTLIVGALVTAVFYTFYVLTTSSSLLLDNSLGIVPIALAFLAERFRWSSPLTGLILMSLGASLLVQICKLHDENIRNFVVTLLFLSYGAALITSRLNEVYLIQVMPWLIILSVPTVTQKKHRLVWVGTYVCVTSIFFYVRVYAWTRLGLG